MHWPCFSSLKVFLEKDVLKYTANLLENTHVKVGFLKTCIVILLKSHFHRNIQKHFDYLKATKDDVALMYLLLILNKFSLFVVFHC